MIRAILNRLVGKPRVSDEVRQSMMTKPRVATVIEHETERLVPRYPVINEVERRYNAAGIVTYDSRGPEYTTRRHPMDAWKRPS